MNTKLNLFIVCLILLLNISIINAETANEWSETGITLAFDFGKYEESLVAFNKSLELNPTNANVWRYQGIVFGLLNRYEEAMNSLNKAIELDPDNSNAWTNKANLLSELEKYEEAFLAYDKAIELDPDNSNAWENKAYLLSDLESYEEALLAYDKAIKADPDNSYAWTNKANLLSELERYEEALLAYDKAIEVDPDDSYAWGSKAYLLSDLDRYEEALLAYDKAIEIDPDDSYAWESKASLLERLNRNEEALATFDEAIEINPNNYDLWISKGSFLRNLERYEEALSAYDKAIAINSNESTGWANKAYLFEQLGRYEEALVAFNKSNEENPTNYSWKHIAYLCQKLERNEDALEAINKALEIFQQDEDAWNQKGDILLKIGRYEDAMLAFDRAIEINPQSYNAWYQKREALEKLEMSLKTIRADFYIEPNTGKIMDQLELDMNSLFDISSKGNIPKNIQLNYKFNGQKRIEKFIISNNSYSGKITVDLNKRNDYPFEDYNTTIFLYYDYQNQSIPFTLSINKSLTIDSWGQPRRINFQNEGNKIEITLERVNKKVTEWLYIIGVAIILTYLITFLVIYRKSPYDSDMFAVFNSFSFLFFVALVVAGVREYIFISKWAAGFFILAIICFGCILIKRFKSRTENNILKQNEEKYKNEIKEILKRNEDKINLLIKNQQNDELIKDSKVIRTELKLEDETQKPK